MDSLASRQSFHKIPLDPVLPVDNFIIVDFWKSMTFKTAADNLNKKNSFVLNDKIIVSRL